MAGAAVAELTTETFDEIVATSPVPVVVDVWAEWCPPCHALARVLAELASEHDDLRFWSLDVDAHPGVAARYEVMSFPTLLVFDRGELVGRLIGARGKRHLQAELDAILGR